MDNNNTPVDAMYNLSTYGQEYFIKPTKYSVMTLTQELKDILQNMWRLDNRLQKDGKDYLSKEETIYYNANLPIIKQYYLDNAFHWDNQKEIN